MIALATIDGSSHGIAAEPACHSLLLYPGMELERGIERSLGGAIKNQFESPEQPAASNIANVRMMFETLGQSRGKFSSARPHRVQQALVANGLLHCERGGTSSGVPDISVPVLESAGASLDGLTDCPTRQHGPNRLISAAQPLGDDHNVRSDVLLGTRVQRSRASHATHDLVQDQQHAVTVANLADAFEVPANRRNGPQRRADHRLGDKRGYRVGTEFDQFGLKFVGDSLAIRYFRFAIAPAAIGIARCDMMCLDQDWRESLPSPSIAAYRQRSQCVAVIALPPGNETATLRLTNLYKVLAG